MKLNEIEVTRIIPAKPEDVFDVWINPKSPGGPWHGAARLIIDPVVDGLFFFFAVNHEGRTCPHYGRFIRIDRPSTVEYTWVSEATKGSESVVTLTFKAAGGQTEVTLHQTEVTLRHTGVPDDKTGHQHKDGWTWALSMLAERFASSAR